MISVTIRSIFIALSPCEISIDYTSESRKVRSVVSGKFQLIKDCLSRKLKEIDVKESDIWSLRLSELKMHEFTNPAKTWIGQADSFVCVWADVSVKLALWEVLLHRIRLSTTSPDTFSFV